MTKLWSYLCAMIQIICGILGLKIMVWQYASPRDKLSSIQNAKNDQSIIYQHVWIEEDWINQGDSSMDDLRWWVWINQAIKRWIKIEIKRIKVSS